MRDEFGQGRVLCEIDQGITTDVETTCDAVQPEEKQEFEYDLLGRVT